MNVGLKHVISQLYAHLLPDWLYSRKKVRKNDVHHLTVGLNHSNDFKRQKMSNQNNKNDKI